MIQRHVPKALIILLSKHLTSILSFQTYPIQKKKKEKTLMEYLRDYAHLRTRTHGISAMVKLRSLLTREIGSWFLVYIYGHTTTA